VRFLQKYYYYLIILVTLLVMFTIAGVDTYLKNEVATQGILSFELAQTPERSQQIIQSWDEKAKVYAAFSLGIDYLFLVFYTLFFIISTYKISKNNIQIVQKTAFAVSLLFLLAGIFDALENYYLFQILVGNAQNDLPEKAALFAHLKFAFLGVGVVYLLLALLSLLLSKNRQ